MTPERWARLTEWPLIGASLVFLVAYAWEVIANLQGSAQTAAEAAMWATWALFLADYIVELSLTPHGGRWKWFHTHLFDLTVIVLPMLRPLRVLRLITLLNVLQRTAGAALRERIAIYTAAAAALLVFLASLAVLDAERGNPHATITTFPKALWWAFVTITTVGYGDYTPVTFDGRVIAVGLMIGGIALLGVVTATLASWIVERVSATDAEKDAVRQAATVAHIQGLENRIDELQRTLLDAIRTAETSGDAAAFPANASAPETAPPPDGDQTR